MVPVAILTEKIANLTDPIRHTGQRDRTDNGPMS